MFAVYARRRRRLVVLHFSTGRRAPSAAPSTSRANTTRLIGSQSPGQRSPPCFWRCASLAEAERDAQYDEGRRGHRSKKMVEPVGNLGRHKRKRRSRVVVGFNRLGIVLGVPFLLIAAVLAFLQWQNPTGRPKVPEGAIARTFDDLPEPAKQLIAKQRAA